MPVQRGPGVVEHPVDDAGRGLGRIHVRVERLELRTDVVVVFELRLGDVVLEAPGYAVTLGERDVEWRERGEYRPRRRRVKLSRLGIFPERLQLRRREHAGQVILQRNGG